jgi:hypothetical protein
MDIRLVSCPSRAPRPWPSGKPYLTRPVKKADHVHEHMHVNVDVDVVVDGCSELFGDLGHP